MQGTRLRGDFDIFHAPNGAYGKNPRVEGRWEIKTPNGYYGGLKEGVWSIVEDEDGAITVSPSIRVSDAQDREMWHGFLEHGVWRSV